MTTRRAPRDSASKPSAPLPAKGRGTQAIEILAAQLKSVSRTRSGVGRSPGASGNRTSRLRHVPAMMRTRLRLAVRRTAVMGRPIIP
jgi:hypothetical protein